MEKNEPLPFGLGVPRQTYQLRTSFRPLPISTAATIPPPYQRDRFSADHLSPGPLLAAEAHQPILPALPHLDALPKSRLAPASADSRPPTNVTGFPQSTSVPAPLFAAEACLPIPAYLLHLDALPKSRLAPVSADPDQTTAHYMHASDHARSNRATVFRSRLSRLSHRLAMLPTGSRTAATPSIWLGWLPQQRHRSALDTAPLFPCPPGQPPALRGFALGASNVCLIGENPTCCVPALWGC